MDTWQEPWELDAAFELCATDDIPLLGVVAAGQPYQAFPIADTLTVPTMLWAGKKVFALRVRGSSMIDEGIHDGDFLVVEPRVDVDNGQTVVAEVDGSVTVKLYHREADGAIRLQPANPEMLPLIVRGGEIRIIGVVVGVMRKFGFGNKPAGAGLDSVRSQPPQPAARPAPRTAKPDPASIDLAVNAIDMQLSRWNAAIEHAQRDRKLRKHVAEMAALGRDLQALRDWCSRTHKPGLRRALVDEAIKIMRRMQRLADVVPVQLPELLLHCVCSSGRRGPRRRARRTPRRFPVKATQAHRIGAAFAIASEYAVWRRRDNDQGGDRQGVRRDHRRRRAGRVECCHPAGDALPAVGRAHAPHR